MYGQLMAKDSVLLGIMSMMLKTTQFCYIINTHMSKNAEMQPFCHGFEFNITVIMPVNAYIIN